MNERITNEYLAIDKAINKQRSSIIVKIKFVSAISNLRVAVTTPRAKTGGWVRTATRRFCYESRDHEVREHIPHTWASSNDILFQSNFST